jgi:hypothetical protein
MIEIRSSRKSDEKEIKKLFKICFGKDISLKEWQWKYKKSPWGSVSYVALYNNKMISHYGGVRYPFQIKDKVFWAYQSCDAMTHPDHRGKFLGEKPVIAKLGGLFLQENTMDFTFGFPSERNGRLLHLALGWCQHRKVVLFKKNLIIEDKIKVNPDVLYVGWDSITSKELDDLWKNSGKNYPLSIQKNSKYLFWRYLEHPSKYYTLLTLREVSNNKINAFAVIRCCGYEMNICDIFYGRTLFLSMIEAFAKELQVRVINILVNANEEISHYLIYSGYKPVEYMPLAVRIMAPEELTEETFFNNYCYRLGDYDDV